MKIKMNKYPLIDDLVGYVKTIADMQNEFLEGQDWFANPIVFITKPAKVTVIAISFSETKQELKIEDEIPYYPFPVRSKKGRYNYTKDGITYMVRPSDKKYFSQESALNDARELILEILNKVHDED